MPELEKTEQERLEEEKEKEAEEKRRKKLKDALSNFTGAPTVEQIEAWKAKYDQVFTTGFSATELFIFRSMQRQEYVELQTAMQSQKFETVYQYEEAYVRTCMLWASDSQWATRKAGTISTLFEQIQQQSNFVPASMASMLVIEL